MRRRRWIRSCYVSTDGPWQEIGPLKLRSISLAHHHRPRHKEGNNVGVWAVTDSGELVFRRGVTPENPAVGSIGGSLMPKSGLFEVYVW